MEKKETRFSFTKTNLFIFATFLIFSSLYAQEFPLRSKYPSVKTISTESLAKGLGKTLLVVDARNQVEFNAIHIKGAFNDKVGNMNFGEKLNALTKEKKSEKIVFYCNGGMCKKSFKANIEAKKLGYTNTFSYDAGIFVWANAHPENTLLMGKILLDKSALISQKEFSDKLLEKSKFEKQSASNNSMLIDVRDPAQRKMAPKFKNKIIKSSMDKLVNLLNQKYFKNKVGTKTLYFFDAVGKQVRWLQYYLEEYGYNNYYFLKGGVKAYSK